MPWTPLHAALGENSSDFTFAMVERAVDERVEETTDLDWKDRLPLASSSESPTTAEKQQKAEELAKDVAAMANSGGGMIVYGVDETTIEGRQAAGALRPVGEVTSDSIRDIRRAANNLIYPPVSGLDFYPLHPEDDRAEGVLALLVPDSQDAPHLVHPKTQKDWFQAPWRDGPHTRFMGERQLADAYRRREQGRREHESELSDLYEGFLTAVGATQASDGPVWTVAVARPLGPVRDSRRLDSGTAHRVIQEAADSPLVEEHGALRSMLWSETRRGLQLFFRTMGDAVERPIITRVEVHGDGSVAVGITRYGIVGPNDTGDGHVPVDDFEVIGRDLIALLLSVKKTLGVVSDYEVSVGVSPYTEIFRYPDSRPGYYQPFQEPHRVRGFRRVHGLVVSQFGRQAFLDSAVDVIKDVVSQTGYLSKLSGAELEAAVATKGL